MSTPKIVTISLPEYKIDTQPSYQVVGAEIDKVIGQNFEGTYLARELSITDHPQYSLDDLANIIVATGTDKYDPNRKGVGHEDFEPYKVDIQAGLITVEHGQIQGESFSEDIKRFYENTLLDRGYRLRIDLIVLYDPKQMIQATKDANTKSNISPHLEQYLWRFKNPERKPDALVGIIKIER
jgi:hypothetical protein